MKVPSVSGLAVVAFLSLHGADAQAQTANSTPTAPASPGATSTVGPSTGGVAPNAGTSKIGAPTPTEQTEQRKSDKDMNICKGC